MPEIELSGPIHFGMDDLLELADAWDLLRELAALEEAQAPGASHETVIFGILDQLQDHLDETGPEDRPYGVFEMRDVIRAWFTRRIAEEQNG